jgi:hypothetical protein
MPNWCENSLTVSGSIEALDKWRVALANDKTIEPVLQFNKLMPLPPEEEENWYEWHNEHWGTKWDIDKDEGTPWSSCPTEYSYSFDTAWGPPVKLFDNISIDFPDVCFELSYWEQGMCFAGNIIFQNGQVMHQEHHNGGSAESFAEEYFGWVPWEDEE